MARLGLVLIGVGLWNVVWGLLHIAGVSRPVWLGTRSSEQQAAFALVGIGVIVLGYLLHRRDSARR